MSIVDEALAERLDNAALRREPVENAGRQDVDIAYKVQESLVSRRIARGEVRIGWKLGFTSRAKMEQMGITEIIVGRLTSEMSIADGGDVDGSRFIHPRVEPEVAFRLGHKMGTTISPCDLVGAIDGVAPALEIIDSRYHNFQFTLADVIADNTSAAGFALGTWSPVSVDLDLKDRAVSLSVGGKIVERGSTGAILGDPFQAIQALSELAERRRWKFRPGDVILAGAATPAVPITQGDVVEATIGGLGSVTLRLDA